jgi:hypothetical protein
MATLNRKFIEKMNPTRRFEDVYEINASSQMITKIDPATLKGHMILTCLTLSTNSISNIDNESEILMVE